MTISEALVVLQGCDHLKITQRHISASKRKTRLELMMMAPEESEKGWASGFYNADVSIRCKKGESFESLLIRAGSLVAADHLPVRRVPAPQKEDRCACGATGDLVWNQQLQHRVCRRCALAWERAALNNDLGGPSTSKDSH